MIESTFLYREIHEQPGVLARMLVAARPAAEQLAAAILRRGIGWVLIAARGSSDNAARYANYLFGAANGLVVGLATPSLFTLYEQPPRLGNMLVLGISQSGRSPDIVAVLTEARRQGALTAAITNDPGSDLARAAEHVLDLHAGEERSLAATKTYTAELAAIALLSTILTGDQGRLDALHRAPSHVAAALTMPDDLPRLAERLRYLPSCVVVGRGYNYSTAFELALKLKELTYTQVEAYSSADFMHGPVALVEAGFPVIVVAPSGVMCGEMRDFVSDLRMRGAEPWVISDDEGLLSGARVRLHLPVGVPEWLSPVVAIVPGQLLAMYLAAARGHDPDRPRGLHKITETR